MIIFLLGKYNCWFFLEVIKKNFIEVEKDEVVLVERLDCFFVYNLKSII